MPSLTDADQQTIDLRPEALNRTIVRLAVPAVLENLLVTGTFMPDSFAIALFHSTSAALRAEKVVGERGIKVKLIPVPRQLSSDCGVCLRFPREQETQVRTILADARVEVQAFHPI